MNTYKKADWVADIGDLLAKDESTHIDYIDFTDMHVPGWETVRIHYQGGYVAYINVTGKTKGQILIEIANETYGFFALGQYFPEDVANGI